MAVYPVLPSGAGNANHNVHHHVNFIIAMERGGIVVSRRKQRKQLRLDKKRRKDLYYRKKDILQNEEPEAPKKKNRKNRKKNKSENSKDEIRQATIEHQKKLIQEEEKEIRKYEKLLKLKSYRKRNKLPKSFYLEGLADLIEICDGRIEKDNKEEKENENPPVENDSEKDDDEDEDQDEEEEMDLEDEDEEMNLEDEDEEMNQEEETPEFREDIYGFVRDREGNIVETKSQEDMERKQRLMADIRVDENVQRKLRGLLNRLTSANIKSISREILELTRTHSRYMIQKGLMNCLDGSIVRAEYNLPAKLVAEMAMLIAILYFEIGEETGGYFLHSIIKKFDELFNDDSQWKSTENSGGKRLNNVLVLILNLYSTGLIDSQLIYDILEKFCERFSEEKSIEIIDTILKTSGFLLRKEDPIRMKSLVVKIQKLSTEQLKRDGGGNRVKFMLESLMAIKNNNVSKIRTTETIVMNDLIEATLKAVIQKPRVVSIPGPYAAVLQSSHWFSYTKEIVPLEPESDTVATATQDIGSISKNVDIKLRDRICRSLRINTPLRRELFTAMMACTDYLDAAGKLITIGKKQFSEIINVVLHVGINEKTYNEFYYYLIQHLAHCDRKFKLALDFAIRDKISDLESLPAKNRTNLARLMVQLLKSNTLSITCLKVIHFSDMNETYVEFIRNILSPILADDDRTISAVLSKIPRKDSFASAIKLFISCFMDSSQKEKASSVGQLRFKLKI